MPAPCVWNDWLPEPLASQARIEEPKRLAALTAKLATVWQESKATLPIRDAASATLPYIPLMKALLDAKAEPETSHLQSLAETLLDVVLSCEADTATQARWGALLHRVLKSNRRKLALVVPWRPWYEMLRRQNIEPASNFEGAGVKEARRHALVQVLHRLRRFFPAGSAAEIWQEFRPALLDPSSFAAYEALGWLAMLLPTHGALRKDGDWGEWAVEWMPIWGAVVHSHYWESLWMGLFARLAKHDVHGLVDWPTLLPEIWTRFLWVFSVPVGAATASPPFSHGGPGNFSALFANDIGSRSAAVAKAAVYLIGRRPPAAVSSRSLSHPSAVGGQQRHQADEAPQSIGGRSNARNNNSSTTTSNNNNEVVDVDDDDPALVSFEFAATLLEQYYHPSNGGKWTAGLATFLKSAATHLNDRLVAEHYAAEGCVTAASDDEAESDGDDEDGEGGGSDGEGEPAGQADDDTSTDDEIAAVGLMEADTDRAEQGISPTARRHLTLEARTRVGTALLRLAVKGQSSKDGTLRRTSSAVLASLAYIVPELVLPEVHKHFVTALGTVTAARQYAGAIQTLSLCVRPLLLAGLRVHSIGGGGGSGEEEQERGPEGTASGSVQRIAAERDAARRAAAQSIVDAMMATLPGIDANDPPKSLATFRLYCSVLSSVGQLSEEPSSAPHALPLYTDAWAEELLSRVFAIISNLDAPEHGSGEHGGGGGDAEEDGDSFLLDGNSMFRPLMELLYVRLPPGLRTAAIRRTASFLLDNVFASVHGEAAILCNAIAWADPQTTSEALMHPLLRLLTADAENIYPSGVPSFPVNGAGVASGARVAAAAGRLSKVQENSIKWRLGLLSSASFHLGPALVAHEDALRTVLGALAAAPSQGVQEAASRALSSVLVGLVSYYPVQQYAPCPARLVARTPTAAMVEEGSPFGTAIGMDVDAHAYEDNHDNGGGTNGTGVYLECFIDKYGNGDGGQGLTWHEPSSEEVQLAEALMGQFLVAPAKQLLELCGGGAELGDVGGAAGTHEQKKGKHLDQDRQDVEIEEPSRAATSSNNTAVTKELLRSLLLQVEGAINGVRSCLPDFDGCSSATVQDHVGVVGRLGASVGTPEQRHLATKALTAASHSISLSDADTLALCLRVMDQCLSVGASEYSEAGENAGAWASDERWTAEPAVVGLLLDSLADVACVSFPSSSTCISPSKSGGGGVAARTAGGGKDNNGNGGGNGGGGGYGLKWRRRRPRWITSEKVALSLQWRASQACYRWYASASRPTLPLSALSPTYLAALTAVVRLLQQGPAAAWEPASAILERAMKRYPVLVPPLFASLFAGLAKIPHLMPVDYDRSVIDIRPQLRKAARNAAVAAAAAAAAGNEAESEAEQAMVVGPAALFTNMSMWRLVTRNIHALEALFLALIASAAHAGAKAQLTVTLVFLTMVFRYMPPPIYGPDAAAAVERICEDALAAASGQPLAGADAAAGEGGASRFLEEGTAADHVDTAMATSSSTRSQPQQTQHQLPWRYTVAANSLPVLLLHKLTPAMAATLARHYLKCLTDDVVLTRQVAAAGLNALLRPLWHVPSAHSGGTPLQEVSASADAVDAATNAIAEALADPQEASRFATSLLNCLALSHPTLSANEGEAARILALSRDNAYVRTLAHSLAINADWPRTRYRPSAVSAGHFAPMHARLIQVLCLASPTSMLAALRGPIETVLAKPQDVDRAAVAAVAEALAGIVASGAPFSGAADLDGARKKNAASDAATTEAWKQWVGPSFAKGLANAPLDWALDLWGSAALQYALFELHETQRDACLSEVLDTALSLTGSFISASTGGGAAATAHVQEEEGEEGGGEKGASLAATTTTAAGATTGAMYKRLNYASNAVQELTNSIGGAAPPAPLRTLLARCLDELPSLINVQGDLLRKAVSCVAADVISSLTEAMAACGIETHGVGTNARKDSKSSVQHANTSTFNGGDASGSDMAVDAIAVSIGGEGEECGEDAVMLLKTSLRGLRRKGFDLLDVAVRNLQAATMVLRERSKSAAAGDDGLAGAVLQPPPTRTATTAVDIDGSGADEEVLQIADAVLEADLEWERAEEAEHEHQHSMHQAHHGVGGCHDKGDDVIAAAETSEEDEGVMIDPATVAAMGEMHEMDEDDDESLVVMMAMQAEGEGREAGDVARRLGGGQAGVARKSGTKSEEALRARSTTHPVLSEEDERYQAALSTVSFSLELTVQLLACNSSAMGSWIVKLLPSLLRLQELVPPELQYIARKALVAAKYQRFGGADALAALGVLQSSLESELWSERAAALAFLQYFWFRHVLLLGPTGTEQIVGALENRLIDDKLEVRELAAVTLSGVMRGLPPHKAALARQKYLATALKALPGRRRRRGEVKSAPPPAPVAQRHGAALALKALVLSSPYDVPNWLPEVLMALVRLSTEPPPVRSAVTTALAEFRRTHPEDEGGLAEVKEALTVEQWEAIRDASTNPASYFV